MKYAPLGRSGLMVSRICLGGNSWGAAGRRQWAAFGIEESRPFFKRALDCGINFFDTADAYNAGESEEIIGRCLIAYARREDVVISTKGGLKMGNGPNDVGVGRKHLMAGVDASLRRLRTDYIDVFQLHRLDGVTPLEETMQTLADLVRAGKIRYVGGSTMPAWRFAQMIMLADWKGYPRPVAMQNLYNLIQREEEREMNRLCEEQGVGLIPYSPLARGFLAGNRHRAGGGDTERARNDSNVAAGTYRDCDWEIVERLKKVALGRNASPAQAALAWLLSKPVMGAPIIGATGLDQLTSAAQASEIRLSEEEVRLIEEPYQHRVPPAA